VSGRTTYDIRDADGHLKAKRQREDNPDGSKRLWWEMPDGSRGLNGSPLANLPLYGSERVRHCDPDELVVVVEGEKAAQALLDAGFNALGTVTGAGATPGPEALEVLSGFEVVLWTDNDDPGRSHMERVATDKENLARSVIQVEPSDRGKGLLTVKLRQTKHNFGPKAEPSGAKLTFTEEKITVAEHSLDATELAQEATLNARDRVMLVLKDGAGFPADIVERAEMPLGTVKNALTDLRKRRLIENTAEVNPHTKAREVTLTEEGRTCHGCHDYIKDSDEGGS
jgi:hypothetical protein